MRSIINGILGAFTTSFETFIIPTLAFNWAYWSQERRDACPKRPLARLFGRHGWTVAFTFNWIIFVVILVFGAGFGIWASIKGERWGGGAEALPDRPAGLQHSSSIRLCDL